MYFNRPEFIAKIPLHVNSSFNYLLKALLSICYTWLRSTRKQTEAKRSSVMHNFGVQVKNKAKYIQINNYLLKALLSVPIDLYSVKK